MGKPGNQEPPRKPFIIPVFIPHQGCPHQCLFCNQKAVTGLQAPRGADDLRGPIDTFLQFRRDRRRKTEIAYYGGSFLGLPAPLRRESLALAAQFVARGQVDGIRFSTRPDNITAARLDQLAAFPVTTVELGAQSMEDHVLEAAQRGHSAADTCSAVARLKRRGYRVGLQMMVGLPGETQQGAMLSGRRLAALAPDFVRIYPTVVLPGTGLAQRFRQGRFRPLSLEQAVVQVKELYALFSARGIPVIRMGLPASPGLVSGRDLVAGPFHPAFGHLVHAAGFYDRAAALLESTPPAGPEVTLHVHPRSISRMRGLANSNLKRLKQVYRLKQIRVRADAGLDRDVVRLDGPTG